MACRLSCLAMLAALAAALPARAEDPSIDAGRFVIHNGTEAADPADADGTKPGEPETAKEKKEDGGVIVEAPTIKDKEQEPIGAGKAPAWTLHRRFASTRVYVQQKEGAIEFEQWLEFRYPRGKHKNPQTRLRTELEIGLPYRLQLDLYLLTKHERSDVNSAFAWRGASAELRWAIADWNVIPGNPTFYFEYLLMDGEPDFIEPKLLLGGDIIPRLHWGLNIVYERSLAHRHYNVAEEYKVTGSVAYGILDNILSVGAEVEWSYNVEGSKDETVRFQECLVGPSIQWRPMDQVHLDIVPLVNIHHDPEGKRGKVYVIFGYEF